MASFGRHAIRSAAGARDRTFRGRARARDVRRRRGAQHGPARQARDRGVRARTDRRGARCRMAGSTRRSQAADRCHGRLSPVARRRGRDGCAVDSLADASAVARRAVRRHAASVHSHGGRSAVTILSLAIVALSLRTRRVQDGLGAQCAGTLARTRMRSGRHAAPWRNAERDRGVGARVVEAPRLSNARTCSSCSRACSIRHARPRANTRCGRIVMSERSTVDMRTASSVRSSDSHRGFATASRSARDVRLRISSAATPISSAATSRVARRTSRSSTHADCQLHPYITPIDRRLSLLVVDAAGSGRAWHVRIPRGAGGDEGDPLEQTLPMIASSNERLGSPPILNGA